MNRETKQDTGSRDMASEQEILHFGQAPEKDNSERGKLCLQQQKNVYANIWQKSDLVGLHAFR